jgi:hypothetical protein
MILTGGIVNPPSNISFSDGSEVNTLHGKMGEMMISGLHGNLYTQTYNGNMFHGYATNANQQAVTLPIYSTTSPTFILYNPKSSNINCVLVHYVAGWVSGTNVEGNIMLGVITNAPAAIATGSPITAFTGGTVLNGYLGGGSASRVRFGSATIVAATQFLPLGLSDMVLDTAKSTSITFLYDFNGTIIVPPGVAVFSCASVASVALYNQRISWYEFPT